MAPPPLQTAKDHHPWSDTPRMQGRTVREVASAQADKEAAVQTATAQAEAQLRAACEAAQAATARAEAAVRPDAGS